MNNPEQQEIPVTSAATPAAHILVDVDHFEFDHPFIALQAVVVFARERGSGRCVGSLFMERKRDGNTLFIAAIQVDEASRRMGVGRALLMHAKSLADNRGLSVEAGIYPENKASYKLFRHELFRLEDVYINSSNGKTAALMEWPRKTFPTAPPYDEFVEMVQKRLRDHQEYEKQRAAAQVGAEGGVA
ncbi:MAG: GNAT family N-acetyltransferase [Phycisphaeraceae bacterium]|nr:MAG: GNAT family N-acetyltransferase [Phycisphaeraceae bacterium]